MTWTFAGRVYACPITLTAHLLSGRWKSNVLWHVWQGTDRFNQLSRALPEVSRAALMRVLRELEQDGLLTRRELGKRPAPVEYALTPLGASLGPLLGEMAAWGRSHAGSDGAAPGS